MVLITDKEVILGEPAVKEVAQVIATSAEAVAERGLRDPRSPMLAPPADSNLHAIDIHRAQKSPSVKNCSFIWILVARTYIACTTCVEEFAATNLDRTTRFQQRLRISSYSKTES